MKKGTLFTGILIVTALALVLALGCTGQPASPTPSPTPTQTTPATSPASPKPTTPAASPSASPSPSPSASPTQAAAGTFKIGGMLPLSGSGAKTGIEMQRGAELAVEEINAKGGITIGGKKYNLQFVARDDKYTAEGGVAAGNQLVYSDGVKFILGPVSSAVLLAVQPSIFEPNKVIHFVTSWSNVVGPTHPYTFRISSEPGLIWPGLLEWLKKTYPDKTKLAPFEPNDATGKASSKITLEAAKAQGFSVVGEEYYERSTTDFYPIITRLMSAGSNLWTSAGAAGEQGLILKQAYEKGYNGLLVGWGSSLFSIRDIAGEAATEKLFIAFLSLNYESPNIKPGQKALADKYWAKHGKTAEMTEYVEHAYDTIYAITTAVQAASSIDDVDKILKAFETAQLPLAQGTSALGGEKTYGIKRAFSKQYGVSRIAAGKWETLTLVGPVPVP